MITAKGCKDGIYGPVIMAARLRVQNGEVTILDCDDLHQHALVMTADGKSFRFDTTATGMNAAPGIQPLPETEATAPVST